MDSVNLLQSNTEQAKQFQETFQKFQTEVITM